jgi:hypothetical protein
MHSRPRLGIVGLKAGLLFAGSAVANPITSVSVGGHNYGVTYEPLDISTLSGLARLKQQPWWGN